MFERFTENARTVVSDAQRLTRDRGEERIGPEHLLLALYRAPRTSIAAVALTRLGIEQADVEADLGLPRPPLDGEALATLGIDLDAVRRQAEETFGPGALDRTTGARGRSVGGGQVPFSPEAKKVLERSLREAIGLGHHHLGTEHILLGLLHGGVACDLLVRRGASLDGTRDLVTELVRERRAG